MAGLKGSYSLVALLDVLGYRQQLEADKRDGAFSFLENLQTAFQCFQSVNEAEIAYTAISDTIILSCHDRSLLPIFIAATKKVFLAFLQRGLLLRGGIAYGQHFKAGYVTYSQALALAYELESTRALHPRIVVDINVLALPEAPKAFRQKLFASQNGTAFVNIVGTPAQWRTVYSLAQDAYNKMLLESLASDGKAEESAHAKHLWFQDFLLTHPLADANYGRYIPSPEIMSAPRGG